MKKLVALAAAGVFLSAATPPQASVDIDIDGLRNTKGSVHACLTRSPGHFPDCKSDPAALRQTVSAAAHRFHFEHLAPGRYAIAVFHDENNNLKLDKMAGIPKEGFAFSRNPSIKFRAPKFEEVVIDLPAGTRRAQLKMHYLL